MPSLRDRLSNHLLIPLLCLSVLLLTCCNARADDVREIADSPGSSDETVENLAEGGITEAGIAAKRQSLEARRRVLTEQLAAMAAADQPQREPLSKELALLSRLDFYLLQHLSALRHQGDLRTIEQRLTEDEPSSPAAGAPPSYSELDTLRDSLAAEIEHRSRAKMSVEGAVSALEQARREFESREKARRRAAEVLEGSGEPHSIPARSSDLSLAVLESSVAAELVRLREVELGNEQNSLRISEAKRKLFKSRIATLHRSATFRDEYLQSQLSRLDEREKQLRTQLDTAKGELELCDSNFFAASQSNGVASNTPGTAGFEQLESLRLARETAQSNLSIIGARLHLVHDLRELWKRRAAALSGERIPLELKQWRVDLKEMSTALDAQVRTQNSRLSELRRTLSELEAKVAALEGSQESSLARRWLLEQRKHLQKAAEIYSAYLDELEDARRLAEKVVDDFGSHAQTLDLLSPARNFGAAVIAVWDYELFSVDDRPITVHKILIALILVLAGLFVSRSVSKLFSRRVLLRFGVASGAAAALESLVFYFFLIFFTLFALRLVHVPLTVFTVLGGAVAIGLGFGSQNIMNNFISGLILLLERPVRVGDLVEVDGYQGRIQQIGARSTRIVTTSNIDLVVPNSMFLERNVINWTLSDSLVRTQVRVGLTYGTDPETVKAILLRAVQDVPEICREPLPFVIFSDFGDSSLVFDLFFWFRLLSMQTKMTVESDVRVRIAALLKEAGMTIPFPQRDVWFDAKRPIEVRVRSDR